VAIVEEPRLRLIDGFDSIYAMASAAIDRGIGLSALIGRHGSDQTLDYDEIYRGESQWRLMVPLDHPDGPARILVSGTGLTHLGSARDRQAMHEKDVEQNLTDSMKMFRWGVEAGRPAAGEIGVAPEWFYKGNGSILRAPGEPLDIPSFAEDGGEEAEIVGLYLIGPDGAPRRIGMAVGNEFSDHQFEKRNYLNLAGSKIRTCSIGPEVVIDQVFDSIAGEVSIQRGDSVVWSKAVRSGQAEMCHSLANIEHHHFKFEGHRRPGDLHVHYFGAHSLSFGDGVRLLDGDVMVIRFDGFGRALQNPVRVIPSTTAKLVSVISLA
jgi:hypothetical protein